jgi:hypothetical protein
MQHVLAGAELLIESYRRVVAMVGLNVDHPGPSIVGDLAQALDEGRRNTLSAMLRPHSKVVDVELSPRSLEFIELIGDEATNDLVICDRDKNDDVFSCKQSSQIRVVRRFVAVGFRVLESVAKQCIQPAKLQGVTGLEALEREKGQGQAWGLIEIAKCWLTALLHCLLLDRRPNNTPCSHRRTGSVGDLPDQLDGPLWRDLDGSPSPLVPNPDADLGAGGVG